MAWARCTRHTIPRQPYAPQSILSQELMSHRGNTHAPISALRRAAERREPGPLGTRTAPINDSKGCAAVVRAAPCGLDRRRTIRQIFEFGCDTAALTQGNPSGRLPAGHHCRVG
ncbi:ADP-ribosylglycohydrolase family protein [Nocardia sp. NPDC050412]|uniref:ADP-ribosylglycohydrolase family protein n=1 Tax=unclassified Nocardia TaxID=2637762 RepID=UPI00378E9048